MGALYANPGDRASVATLDVHGILERAGADADAPAGSQSWALAQVGVAVAELIEAANYALCDNHTAAGIRTSLVAALKRVGGAA